MYFTFKCIICKDEIQADKDYHGEWVECPICSTVQVVPDPPLPSETIQYGYKIERVLDSSLLWTTYMAIGDTELPGQHVYLRIPSAFFLKYVTDFDYFASQVVKNGILNQPEFPNIIDKSFKPGHIFFVYSTSREAMRLAVFVENKKIFNSSDALSIVLTISKALNKAWDRYNITHGNLNPSNIVINEDFKVQILEMGISSIFTNDMNLLEKNFNIWDYRYLPPGFHPLKADLNDPAYDIYALGGVLYLMLTGNHAFKEPYHDAGKFTNPQKFNPAVTDGAVALINDMLEVGENKKLPDWKAVIDRIEKLRGEERYAQELLSKQLPEGQDGNDDKYNMDFTDFHLPKFEPVGHLTGEYLVPQNLERKKRKKKKRKKDGSRKQLKFKKTIARLATPEIMKDFAKWNRINRTNQYFIGILIVLIMLAVGAAILLVRYQYSRQAKRKRKLKSTKIIESEYNKMEKELIAIDFFYNKNPMKFGSVLNKYRKLLAKTESAGNKDLTKAVKNKIDTIKKKESAALESTLMEIDKVIEELLTEGQYTEALAYLKNYKGNFVRETRPKRTVLTEAVEKVMKELKIKVKKTSSQPILKKTNMSELEDLAKLEKKLLKDAKNNHSSLLKGKEKALDKKGKSPIENTTVSMNKNKFGYPDNPGQLGENGNPTDLTVHNPMEKITENTQTGEKLWPVMDDLARKLMNNNLKGAEKGLLVEIKKTKSQYTRKFIRSLLENIQVMKDLDKTLYGILRDNEGENITLALKDKAPEFIKIKKVQNKSISYVPADDFSSSTKTKYFSVENISLSGKIDLVRKLELKDESLLVAMLCFNHEDYDRARDNFKKIPLNLGERFIMVLEDIIVEDRFSALVKYYKIEYENNNLHTVLAEIKKKKFNSKGEAANFKAALKNFEEKYGETSFYKKHKDIFESIKEIDVAADGASSSGYESISGKLKVGPDKDLLAIIKNAKKYATIHLTAGEYLKYIQEPIRIGVKGLKLIGEKGVMIHVPIEITSQSVMLSDLILVAGPVTINDSAKIEIKNCILKEYPFTIQYSKNVSLENCFSKGLYLKENEDVKLEHCTIVERRDGSFKSAVYIKGDGLEVSDSLIYGIHYGILFSVDGSTRKRKFYDSLIYGKEGLGAEFSFSEAVIKKSVATKKTKLKRYCRTKDNTYDKPEFVNSAKNNWALQENSPGIKDAHDRKNCGVLWDEFSQTDKNLLNK